MSNEHRDLYCHTPFQEDRRGVKPLSILDSSTYNSPGQGFDPSPYMSFSECLHGSLDFNSLAKAYGLSPSSSEVFSSIEGNSKPVEARVLGWGNSTDQIPATPNSSLSFSSSEAGGDEDSGKTKKETQPSRPEDGGECSDKKEDGVTLVVKTIHVISKAKKKAEQRKKEPRFAFMTKSEVDHLEDGYRWRKYGQKAVRNSSYPRNYYRCTTQKCTVKKRVERSFQDPSIVITTYEGQHNHPIPTTIRGSASAMFSHSMLTPAPLATGPRRFPAHLQGYNLVQMPAATSNKNLGAYPQNVNQVPDYGLLQDIVPSMLFRQEP
ncbi:PREDICTED: probable WRKY transcription factor 28 isoform X1 [Populus euphratica]|uniref:Probable WRKY transcription factor 28 isoform X1 n=1 Tax=Populus euphratica TaxID=75702 RepID=A0AAJ6TET4_POPEU|nr:PREDICTED: probable WRKY transcription factor 28 isoform X1 [Populus euphratica]